MYITFNKTKTEKIIKNNKKEQTFEDFLLGINETAEIEEVIIPLGTTRLTIKRDKEGLRNYFNKNKRGSWYIIPQPPQWPVSEIKDHYSSFKIPKKSGGLRDIDAPDDELKLYLTQLKLYFEDTLKIMTHNSAHAYVKERSTITDLKVHQANNSNWFLKLDLKNFFPSHNMNYVLKMLQDIYPIGFLMEDENYKKSLEQALSYAFLEDKLPQGTPLSPTLTNILMMPLDYTIQHELWDLKSNMVYTRYADDMTISSYYNFNWKKVQNIIIEILTKFETPFKVNSDKTRYGSKNGRNWNLGIMLNKDNRLTIGHKQNQRFRATLFHLIQDYIHDIHWSAEEKLTLAGQISYYKAVDPEYTNEVIQRYENKYAVNIKEILKN